MLLKYIFLTSITVFFITVTSYLFLKSPPVWPDEAIYADVARTYLQTGTLSTGIWENTMPGSADCACWYPPFFFYLLALWFKLFGWSIVSQRLMSVLLGLCFFYICYRLSKLLPATKDLISLSWTRLLLLMLIISDVNLLVATRLSRPEILVLVNTYISVYCYAKFFQKNDPLKNFWIFFAGLAAGGAFMTHYMSIYLFVSLGLHLLLIGKKSILLSKSPFYLLAGFLAPIGLYLAFNYHNIPIIIEQIRLIGKLKELYNSGIPLNFIYLIYYLATGAYLYYVAKNYWDLRNNSPLHILIGILLITSWFFSIAGEMHWYLVYPISFVLISMYIIVSRLASRNIHTLSIKHYWYMALVGALVLMNAITHAEALSTGTFRADNQSYERFTSYFSTIKPNTSVFLFSIPDAYYAFNEKKNIKIYKFSDMPLDHRHYYDLLNKSDYIIYNDWYRQNVRGEMLIEYAKLNKKNIREIKEPFQYEITIIEFVPRSQRKIPHIKNKDLSYPVPVHK